jgi:BMFP domain-containing protein YqiC
MNQTSGRIFDELAKVLTSAAGAAQGVRNEFETMLGTQAERILKDLDMVNREEFDAVREMASKAREENEQLKERLAALEEEIAGSRPTKSPKRRSTTTVAGPSRRRNTNV